MRRLHQTAAFAAALLIAACTTDTAEDAEAPAATEMEAPAAAPSLADFAGTWNNTVRLDGVADPVPSTMIADASDRWTMTLEGREPIGLQVNMQGDSVITVSDEYESILRPGVTTTVRTASVMHDGMMMGNVLVTYRTNAGEEQVRGTMEGRRAQ